MRCLHTSKRTTKLHRKNEWCSWWIHLTSMEAKECFYMVAEELDSVMLVSSFHFSFLSCIVGKWTIVSGLHACVGIQWRVALMRNTWPRWWRTFSKTHLQNGLDYEELLAQVCNPKKSFRRVATTLDKIWVLSPMREHVELNTIELQLDGGLNFRPILTSTMTLTAMNEPIFWWYSVNPNGSIWAQNERLWYSAV